MKLCVPTLKRSRNEDFNHFEKSKFSSTLKFAERFRGSFLNGTEKWFLQLFLKIS